MLWTLMFSMLGGQAMVLGIPTDEGDFTLNYGDCLDESWTLHNSRCYYASISFTGSWSNAVTLCGRMGAELATVTVGDGLVFDLVLGGAIHPKTSFWTAMNSTADPTSNCSFVGFTESSDTEFGSAPCNSTGIGYLCVLDPLPNHDDTRLQSSNASLMEFTDQLPNFTVIPNKLTSSPEIIVGVPVPEIYSLTSTVPSLSDYPSRRCPDHWIMSPSNESCYFIAPAFNSGSFFETSSFCQSLDGWLVELEDEDDYLAVKEIVASHIWTLSPWIGLIKPFDDSQIVSLSSLEPPSDMIFQKRLAAAFSPHNLTDGDRKCVGLANNGSLTLFRCNSEGNPFCEKDILNDRTAVTATHIQDDSTHS